MKKLAICLMMTCLSLTLLPIQLNAANTSKTSSVPAPKPLESAEAKTLEFRLTEINSMDKSKMKSAEKKSMRKEVKTINHRLHDGGGVYLSVGALILIIVLLIVLL